jgi:hypothetical protein
VTIPSNIIRRLEELESRLRRTVTLAILCSPPSSSWAALKLSDARVLLQPGSTTRTARKSRGDQGDESHHRRRRHDKGQPVEPEDSPGVLSLILFSRTATKDDGEDGMNDEHEPVSEGDLAVERTVVLKLT